MGLVAQVAGKFLGEGFVLLRLSLNNFVIFSTPVFSIFWPDVGSYMSHSTFTDLHLKEKWVPWQLTPWRTLIWRTLLAPGLHRDQRTPNTSNSNSNYQPLNYILLLDYNYVIIFLSVFSAQGILGYTDSIPALMIHSSTEWNLDRFQGIQLWKF